MDITSVILGILLGFIIPFASAFILQKKLQVVSDLQEKVDDLTEEVQALHEKLDDLRRDPPLDPEHWKNQVM